jgi:AraC-like DNA-binding protein
LLTGGSYIARIADALTKTCIADSAGFRLEDVRCGCGRSGWSGPEATTAYRIVFVRRGCFRRRVDGMEHLLDPATAYFERPGQEQQVSHPVDGGDACTQLTLPPEYVFDGPDPQFTEPRVDLAQRLLLRSGDSDEFVESAVALADRLLQRSAAVKAREWVDRAREAIAADPTLGLPDLARIVSVSPHHLSRTFRAQTGETVSRYRNRIRVRIALERIADGENSLARLAAELGFADQAHLSRVVRDEVRRTPSALRTNLQAAS